MIDPITIEVANKDGEAKSFTISKLPATVAREVVAKYPTSMIPKVGDYATSEATMLLMMRYVSVTIDDKEIKLATKALVDNHVQDVIQLMRLEYEMLEYNTGFFGKGGKSGFLDYLLKKLAQSIMPTLTPLLEQFLAQGWHDTEN